MDGVFAVDTDKRRGRGERKGARVAYVKRNISFPDHLMVRLQMAANEDGKPVSTLLADLAREWLEKRDRRKRKEGGE